MILVEYACADCASRQESWERNEIPVTKTCGACGGHARRKFGGALLAAVSAAPVPGRASGHCHGSPGDCVLTPTAARMLDARIRGDRRAIERETAHQEKAIKEGKVDPHRPPVLGGP